MPSHKLNIAAQTKNYHELALQVNEALNNVDKELLETPDIYAGRTAAYWSVQKGSPECLGIMAKAGANLHRACPHVWEVNDPTGYSEGCIVDPSAEDGKLKVHHALNQTTLSYVTRTCCECSSSGHLKSCSGCKLARYCDEACQQRNWAIHQLVCNRIRKGADLVTVHKKIPETAKTDPGGFEPYDDLEEDTILDADLDKETTDACWEYYDIERKSWLAYPCELNVAIEYVYSKGTFPRYTFRPGCPEADGIEENPITCVPSRDVSTHSICFSHMIDHHIYTGAGRKIRRRELEAVKPEENVQPKSNFLCAPLCGTLE
jgi:hypothetical protein